MDTVGGVTVDLVPADVRGADRDALIAFLTTHEWPFHVRRRPTVETVTAAREGNVAMRRVFVRAGFVKEAHYREAWPSDGGPPLASIGYGILRRDWASGGTTPLTWDDEPTAIS